MSAAPNYVIFSDEKNAIEIPTAPNLLLQWEPRCSGLRSCMRTALGRTPRITGDPGKLYIQWEPKWEGFRAAIQPALGRSAQELEGECPLGMQSHRSLTWSVVLHAGAIVTMLLVSANIVRINRLRTATVSQSTSPYEVIYYSGEELPQMQDTGGAAEGKVGKSGGREVFHPAQAINIARGNKLVDTVADAPDLKLPRTPEPVVNLLTAPAADLGPPPMAAVNSPRPPMGLINSAAAVPPLPGQVKRDKPINVPDVMAGAVQAPPEAIRQIAGARVPQLGTAQVVPPTVSARAVQNAASTPKLALPAAVAVAPPPQLVRTENATGIAGFGAVREVVPPAPTVGGQALSGHGVPGGLGAAGAEAVAPPQQVGAAGKPDGGMIDGAIKALGSLIGGSGDGTPGGGTAVVISAKPGNGVGIPGGGSPGELAMSPNGGTAPGIGGSGGGTGIGVGKGTGTGIAGNGTGSGKSGDGLANGPANGGTSVAAGPGGTGTGSAPGAIPSVNVSGGTAKINLPSFSTPSSGGNPVRGSTGKRNPPAITIIASARSGGAINAYGMFKGAKVYTIYLDTRLGLAVLQYAEKAGATASFEADLEPPEAVAHDLPSDLPKRKLLVACTMDKAGELKNLRVVEGGGAMVTAKLLPALQHWRFRPALKGDQPVEVDAILGFDVDTR